MRTAEQHRSTRETDITVSINLNGTGECVVATGIGFLDHMLEQIAHHGLIDLKLEAKGDLHIDDHHTVEDSALILGAAFKQALGDCAGIMRYGMVLSPMDEALVRVVLDISGRPHLSWCVEFPSSKIGSMDSELFQEWFKAFASAAEITLHVDALAGENSHHIAEACFKGLARALRQAVTLDVCRAGEIPSSKGIL
ncbi:MAG: imidazoleglycerol-phosphate dehydratase HisB [Alphaproteobacteria bacterium]|nr:imidazoleglycerol-phosphate dehydratase HisB [Alphaproteobacteria bacterium]